MVLAVSSDIPNSGTDTFAKSSMDFLYFPNETSITFCCSVKSDDKSIDSFNRLKAPTPPAIAPTADNIAPFRLLNPFDAFVVLPLNFFITEGKLANFFPASSTLFPMLFNEFATLWKFGTEMPEKFFDSFPALFKSALYSFNSFSALLSSE
ncbi:MAG: hypothetical protein HFH72_08915 [Lachnospiraceae bacterium]|nr:hypothetical protein [Lachnospiraceae bacterium]